MYNHYHDGFLALPGDAMSFAWSAPMRDLAKTIGMSDVGLKKLFNSLGIETPPQGYWNKVHAGKPLPRRPRTRARGPGETGRLRLDGRFRGHVEEAGRMPVDGPFETSRVPADLDDLRRQELAAIGKASAPRDLSRPHAGLAELLRKEAARREKRAASRWHWDEPRFDTPLAKRQLRIFSGLLSALAKRGYSGSVFERDEQLRAGITIGDTHLEIYFEVLGKHRTEQRHGYRLPARDLPPGTPLRLALGRPLEHGLVSRWEDGDATIEQGLAGIAADLVVAGEAAFRQGLVAALEHEREQREWLERQEREALAKRNRERLALLEESGAMLRKADEIRTLVDRISKELDLKEHGIGEERFVAWRKWALARADALDPLKTGQVLSHVLLPPESGQ